MTLYDQAIRLEAQSLNAAKDAKDRLRLLELARSTWIDLGNHARERAERCRVLAQQTVLERVRFNEEIHP